MIIVELIGGLGNQMFQYAAALSLAQENETYVKVDTESLLDRTPRKNFTFRDYELDKLAEKPKLIESENRNHLLKNSFLKKLLKKSYITFYEKDNAFDENFNLLGKNTYLKGYFQSYKYIQKHEEEIKKKISFDTSVIDQENSKILSEIENSNSISIHVRRGDYVTVKSNTEYHGVCSLDYYHKALNQVVENRNDVKLFVFSDDISWVKNNLETEFSTVYVDHNMGINSYWDIFLMSKCQHNIIANSSFSWWGAWLNRNNNKKVIAPAKWFANSNLSDKDLIPKSWTRI